MGLRELLQNEVKNSKSVDMDTQEAFEAGYALGQFETKDVSEYIPEDEATEYLESAFEALDKLEGGFESEALEIMTPIAKELDIGFEADENKSAWEKIKDFILKIVKYIKDKVVAFGGIVKKLYKAIMARLKNMVQGVKNLVKSRDEVVKEAENKVEEAAKEVEAEVEKAENKEEAKKLAETVEKETEKAETKEEVEKAVDSSKVKDAAEAAKAASVANTGAIVARIKAKAKAKAEAELKSKANTMLLSKLTSDKIKEAYFKKHKDKLALAVLNRPIILDDVKSYQKLLNAIVEGKIEKAEVPLGLQGDMAKALGLDESIADASAYICYYGGNSFWIKLSEDGSKLVKGKVDLDAFAKDVKNLMGKVYKGPSDIISTMEDYNDGASILLPTLGSMIKRIEKENAKAAKESLKAKGKMSLEELKAVKGKTLSNSTIATVIPYIYKAVAASTKAVYELIVGYENHCRDFVNEELGKNVLPPFKNTNLTVVV